ncbi:22765_t:CDS:2, partial [Dentiscutata erythropus]
MDINSPDSVIDQENNNEICEDQENETIASTYLDEDKDIMSPKLANFQFAVLHNETNIVNNQPIDVINWMAPEKMRKLLKESVNFNQIPYGQEVIHESFLDIIQHAWRDVLEERISMNALSSKLLEL